MIQPPVGHPLPGEKLVRLRADPSKVRVSVRRNGSAWVAKVAPRGSAPAQITTVRLDPVAAVESALEMADEARILGIDLDCELAYPHPQR